MPYSQGNGARPLAGGYNERFAALDERVTNLRQSFTTLNEATSRGFASVEASLTSLGAKVEASQKTPWPSIFAGIGVLLAFLTSVGYLVYSPIRQNQDDLKSTITRFIEIVPDKFISREETDFARGRAKEDRDKLEGQLAGIQMHKLERNEWELRNESINNQIADLNRRIEEIRSNIGDTYSTRDVILDLKTEVDRLRDRLNQVAGNGG